MGLSQLLWLTMTLGVAGGARGPDDGTGIARVHRCVVGLKGRKLKQFLKIRPRINRG